MTFNFKFLCFKCECGAENMEVKVATTSDYHLLFEWLCSNCGKTIRARMSFEDLMNGVPPPPDFEGILEADKDFLKQLHIRL